MSTVPLPPRRQKPPFAVFLAATIVLFFCALSAADSVGFVPDYIDGTVPTTIADSSTSAQTGTPVADASTTVSATQNTNLATGGSSTSAGILPARILIPSVGIDLPVQNPTTHDVDALDALLVNGPARYVDSAKLGSPGNLLIFAHSSHLPIVHNQMFRAFNQIPNLVAGDSITIVGVDGKDYLYSVTSVRKADASDTTIDLSAAAGTKLTLVTCDTLTGKSARFVLEADFVGVSGGSTSTTTDDSSEGDN